MRITEDGVWRYYNCPDPVWSAKCRACREKVATFRAPAEECLNCWKVEIWSRCRALDDALAAVEDVRLPGCPSAFDAIVDSLVGRGIRVIAKASRAPILVVRSGVPAEAYPDGTLDYLLMLYAHTIPERDILVRETLGVLGVKPGDRYSLPVRRGCWRFDDALGPWQTWYPADLDYRAPQTMGRAP